MPAHITTVASGRRGPPAAPVLERREGLIDRVRGALDVLEDGSPLQFEHTGTWQKPAGAEAVVGEWTASAAPLSASDAAKAFRLDDVLERLAKLLPTVVEANARSAEDLAARAARAQALALLLRR